MLLCPYLVVWLVGYLVMLLFRCFVSCLVDYCVMWLCLICELCSTHPWPNGCLIHSGYKDLCVADTVCHLWAIFYSSVNWWLPHLWTSRWLISESFSDAVISALSSCVMSLVGYFFISLFAYLVRSSPGYVLMFLWLCLVISLLVSSLFGYFITWWFRYISLTMTQSLRVLVDL